METITEFFAKLNANAPHWAAGIVTATAYATVTVSVLVGFAQIAKWGLGDLITQWGAF